VAELADALDSKSEAMLGQSLAVAVSLPNGNKHAPASQNCARIAFDYRALNDLPGAHRRFLHALRLMTLCD
jgi:hypothetical protein